MLVALLASICLCLVILFSHSPNKVVVNFAAYTFDFLPVAIYIGLFLVSSNRNLSHVYGADKIYLSPLYFILPGLFLSFGFYYHQLRNKLKLPKG